MNNNSIAPNSIASPISGNKSLNFQDAIQSFSVFHGVINGNETDDKLVEKMFFTVMLLLSVAGTFSCGYKLYRACKTPISKNSNLVTTLDEQPSTSGINRNKKKKFRTTIIEEERDSKNEEEGIDDTILPSANKFPKMMLAHDNLSS